MYLKFNIIIKYLYINLKIKKLLNKKINIYVIYYLIIKNIR